MIRNYVDRLVQHTDGSRFNHIADGKPLDCLVFGSASGTIGAADGLDMATPILVATAIKRDPNVSFSDSVTQLIFQNRASSTICGIYSIR